MTEAQLSETQSNKSMLQQLGEYLLCNLQPYVKANDIDAWQEKGVILLDGSSSEHSEGLCLARWKYIANIELDKFPHKIVDSNVLVALIAAFLLQHSEELDEYELEAPEIDIDSEDGSDSSIVTISVELVDDINVVPNDQGRILIDGQRYSEGLAPIYIAESFELEASVQ